MKKFIWSMMFMLAFTGPALAFDGDPHVGVSGNASLEVVPDEMYWHLKVENLGPKINILAEQHGEIVTRLIDFLKTTGIEKKNIQTTRMQLGERWNHKNGRRIKEGFYAASNITFKLNDLEKYQFLWQNLTQFRGINIQNVSYGYSKEIDVRRDARALALKAARDKASAMAKTLGCTIGEPLVIEDTPEGPDVMRSNMIMADKAGFGMAPQQSQSVSLGQIRIESRVKVIFSLECD